MIFVSVDLCKNVTKIVTEVGHPWLCVSLTTYSVVTHFVFAFRCDNIAPYKVNKLNMEFKRL